jgi:hypothetical protein
VYPSILHELPVSLFIQFLCVEKWHQNVPHLVDTFVDSRSVDILMCGDRGGATAQGKTVSWRNIPITFIDPALDAAAALAEVSTLARAAPTQSAIAPLQRDARDQV